MSSAQGSTRHPPNIIVWYGFPVPAPTRNSEAIKHTLGSNTIMVADGAARMTDADCPHGSCLRQTPISETGQQLICLPHQLWVEVVPARGEDTAQDGTQADVDAVGWKDERQASDVDVTAR
ncbi:MAG: NusG domain II-containing protein [Olsenella profusa]